MRLRLQHLEHRLLRKAAVLDPWRTVEDGNAFDEAENELPENLLEPGRSRLRPGRDDDVALTKPEVVPAPGIHGVIADFARRLQPSVQKRLIVRHPLIHSSNSVSV